MRLSARFYTYDQNNSGGIFHEDDDVSEFVIIEALNAREANAIAETKGLYFDGSGDCPCCGDRWSSSWKGDEGDAEPLVYGTPAKEYKSTWMEKPVRIHYLDGTVWKGD